MVQQKDYYSILEVSKTSSIEEIKQSYKRLALKYHPDKNDSDTSKKIYDINEAFAILSDPDTRRKYDTENEIPPMTDIFKMVFTQMQTFLTEYIDKKRKEQEKDRVQKIPEDIIIKLPVSLEDLFYQRIKKLSIQVLRNGIMTKQKIFISLTNYQTEYLFEGLGDSLDQRKGNIKVLVDIQKHEIYNVDTIMNKYDLWIEHDISLFEYFYGKTFDIKGLDGSVINISKPFFELSNMTYIIKNKGLPYYPEENDDENIVYGDIYIFFKLSIHTPSKSILNNEKVKEIFQSYFF